MDASRLSAAVPLRSRYLAQFDFRYNVWKITDGMRTDIAIKGFDGKRLIYRDSSATAATATK